MNISLQTRIYHSFSKVTKTREFPLLILFSLKSITANPSCSGKLATPRYSSSSQTGKRKTRRPFLRRYLRAKASRLAKMIYRYVVYILPLSYFYHWSTLSRFSFFIRFCLYCFYYSGTKSLLFFLFQRKYLRFYLFFAFKAYSLCFSIYQAYVCFQIQPYCFSYKLYYGSFSPYSDSISSNYQCFYSFSTQIFGQLSSSLSTFFDTDRLIARMPQGGSVMMASKNSPSRKASRVLSIRMIFGVLSSYCSKLRLIFGVKSSYFISALQYGARLFILPTLQPFITRISKSEPKVMAPFVAGGMSSPPVPTKGSMTKLYCPMRAWLHMRKARSLSVEVGPRQMRLLSSNLLLNFAVAILLLQSSMPKQTWRRVEAWQSLWWLGYHRCSSSSWYRIFGCLKFTFPLMSNFPKTEWICAT